MKKSVRTFVLTGAMLLAATGPVFASISGGDPRPPSNPPTHAIATMQGLLTLLGS
jgi:hypothetical protein